MTKRDNFFASQKNNQPLAISYHIRTTIRWHQYDNIYSPFLQQPSKKGRDQQIKYQLRGGGEAEEVVSGVGLDDQILGGDEADGGEEVTEAKGDGAAVVDVAGVAQQTHPGVRLVLHRLAASHGRAGGGGIGLRRGAGGRDLKL